MIEKGAAPRFVLVLILVAYLAFVAGAAVYFFQVGPYGLMRAAFLAADALYQKYVVYETDVTLHEYLWAKARRPDKGVTVYRPDKAFGGYTLVLSTHAQEATLIDMEGRARHRWALPFSEAWPDPPHIDNPTDDGFVYWRAGRVFPNGDLLMIYVGEGETPYGYGLVKMDRNSKVIWTYDERVHHDIDIGEDGRIYVLIHRINEEGVPGIAALEPPFIEDLVAVLSPDGEELQRISLAEALADSAYRGVFTLAELGFQGKGDPLHSNTVEVVDRRVERNGLVFEKGQILVSMRSLATIATVDPGTGRATWALRGPWVWQHDPDLLDDGSILIFDNLGDIGEGGASRLLRIDPATQEILWQYTGSEDETFYSFARARQQMLPNGNILVTESQGGRLFEITAEGEIVWEFVNPQRAGKNEELIPWLTGGIRYDAKDVPFIGESAVGS